MCAQFSVRSILSLPSSSLMQHLALSSTSSPFFLIVMQSFCSIYPVGTLLQVLALDLAIFLQESCKKLAPFAREMLHSMQDSCKYLAQFAPSKRNVHFLALTVRLFLQNPCKGSCTSCKPLIPILGGTIVQY